MKLVDEAKNLLGFQESQRVSESDYLINGTILGGKKVIEYKMCVLSFSESFV
jgi:hypothetical protein